MRIFLTFIYFFCYDINMKKKFTTTAYMRDAENYDIHILDLEDCWLVIKKVNKVRAPFITAVGVNVMDNGYYVVECTPKNESYSLRVFYDEQKQPQLYYFDISNENGIDKDTHAPYYMDIYTDIMIFTKDNKIVVVDEDELNEALKLGDITKQQFEKANKATKKLYNELLKGENKYKNIDFTKYLK